jgi:hypothetical protein
VDELGAHLERVLRQIATQRLRFLLVVRTPPEAELSQFPVLAASVYEADSDRPGTSGVVSRWSMGEAARAWSSATMDSSVAFSDLPASLCALATIPLYLRLMVDSGKVESLTSATSYRLVDHCVQSLIRRSRSDSTQVYEHLIQIAATSWPDLVPNRLARATAGSPDTSIPDYLRLLSRRCFTRLGPDVLFSRTRYSASTSSLPISPRSSSNTDGHTRSWPLSTNCLKRR